MRSLVLEEAAEEMMTCFNKNTQEPTHTKENLMLGFGRHKVGPNVESSRINHVLRFANQRFELVDSKIKQHCSLTQRSLPCNDQTKTRKTKSV
jgi:hypothetical protein